MYSYAAFIRSAANPGANDAARPLTDRFRNAHPEWLSLNTGKGLSVFHRPPPGRSAGAITLPGDRGAILGTLFPKDLETSPRNWRPVIHETLAEDIVRSRGRRLLDELWGGYVAFLSDRGGAVHCVLRDCSGKVPCYTLTHRGVIIVTSDIGLLAGLDLPPFSLNARYVAGFIVEAEMAQRECAVTGITELLAGECLEIEDSRARQFALWDPRIIARQRASMDFEKASRRVRRVTQSCVDFWASKYDRILYRLSGGLDSSSVLGCLKNSPCKPQITCLHVDSGGSDQSELEFARLAAGAAGIDLVVQPGYSQHAKYDQRVFLLPKAPKPSVANLGVTLDSESRNRFPAEVQAEAIWDGEGGDHLFFSSRSSYEAVDYAFERCLGSGFAAHVRGAVRQSGSSLWGVLGKTIRLGLFRGPWRPHLDQDRRPAFLNPAIVPADIDSYIWQPWSADASDLPPGKRLQICVLAWLIHRHRPVPELQYASEHHPLFSQPLMELCLELPIYTLVQGGMNRALERAAFRDCVPERIIRRENKGSVTTTVMSKIRECLPFLRELVLGGVLAQERIIDRSALEPFLVANRPLNQDVLWPFMSCIAAEVWARKWAADGWRI
jgi:asparagine synthase (glutamine-hydrolysing)